MMYRNPAPTTNDEGIPMWLDLNENLAFDHNKMIRHFKHWLNNKQTFWSDHKKE